MSFWPCWIFCDSYPPTHAILDSAYGEHPLQGTRWITAAGARDPHPDRDGIAGMKRAAAWLQAQGAGVLDRIEDPDEGHGALPLSIESDAPAFETDIGSMLVRR